MPFARGTDDAQRCGVQHERVLPLKRNARDDLASRHRTAQDRAMTIVVVVVAALVAAMGLAYAGRAWWAWIFAPAILLAYWASHGGTWGLLACVVAWLAIAGATGLPAIRRMVITR